TSTVAVADRVIAVSPQLGAVIARERRDDALDRALHLFVSEGAIGAAEREAHRQADLPVGNALALVPIELAHVLERVRRVRPNRATNGLGWQAFVDDNRQIADD